jgi:hypothetical protein
MVMVFVLNAEIPGYLRAPSRASIADKSSGLM